MNIDELTGKLKDLFQSQRLAVLATQCEGEPYANLVAFSHTEDLRKLFFATKKDTRKYANLAGASNAAFLIDNRSNEVSDFLEAMAVTAVGSAREAEAEERRRLEELFLNKHPNLTDFVDERDCAIMIVDVSVYYVVTEFQKMIELHVESWTVMQPE